MMMQRWLDFVGDRTTVERALWLYRMIEGFYNQSYRSYHNLDHIRRMLDDMEEYFPRASELEILAIWFHDLIYIPGSSENETQSAWQMTVLMRGIFAYDELVTATSHILATAYGKKQTMPFSSSSKRVRDIDLLSLAAERTDYQINTARIREEHNLPDSVWKAGRRHFIEQMLAQKRIFLTEELHAWFEYRARSNLQYELTKY
jgi:predicted metal-dependent HD superfamily phosphohydrolase